MTHLKLPFVFVTIFCDVWRFWERVGLLSLLWLLALSVPSLLRFLFALQLNVVIDVAIVVVAVVVIFVAVSSLSPLSEVYCLGRREVCLRGTRTSMSAPHIAKQ